jgi:hypothetical protein
MTYVSQHAFSRSQKRVVPPVVFDWLAQFGEEQFDGHGGVIRYFSHDSRRRMEKCLGRKFVSENQKYLDHYFVESATDGTIITVGVRFKRIHRR